MSQQINTKIIIQASMMAMALSGCAGDDQDYSGDSFTEPYKFHTGPMPWLVDTGDLNGDKKPDVVTANIFQTGNNGVSVLINSTVEGTHEPTFAPRVTLATGTPGTGGVVLADFNNDDVLDICTANTLANASDVTIMINQTDPGEETVSFGAPQFFTAGALTHLVVGGDLNNDGKIDLVTGNSGSFNGKDAVSVMINTTDPYSDELSFTDSVNYEGGGIAEGLVLGDINNDGKLDIVEGNTLSSTVTILLNQMEPGSLVPDFVGPFVLRVNFATGVDLGDFNGDGKLDLVAASTLGGAYVLMNETENSSMEAEFSPPTYFYTAGDVTENVVVDDFDRDGLVDFAVNNDNVLSLKRVNGVAVYYNRTAAGDHLPTFDGPYTYGPSPGANSIASADLDGDGFMDLIVGVVSPFGVNGLSVLMNEYE